MAYAPGSAYVSGDGKVTFDQWGRKLDSLGNVAWGDHQSLRGANARPINPPKPQPTEAEVAALAKNWPVREITPPMTQWPVRNLTPSGSPQPNAVSTPQAAPPPGVLAAGGVDPRTGQKVATYFNGGLKLPNQIPTPPTNIGDIMGRNAAPQPSAPQPSAPTFNPLGSANNGQPWRPLQSLPFQINGLNATEPMTPVPGFGMLPTKSLQQWRPWPGDMVTPQQKYTYSDPFAWTPEQQAQQYAPITYPQTWGVP